MEYNDFKEILEKYLYEMQINLDESQVKQFYRYMNLLIEWNEKVNLTAITDPHEIILKHFIDSLTINEYIKQGTTVIDVGSGAGFPGIPLKICRQDIDVVLLDSLNKRVNFLNEVISNLDLQKVVAVHGRAEELARNKQYREKFDCATSRAVANMATLSEYLIPFLKIGGTAICMKGAFVEEELQNSKNAVYLLGAEIIRREEFNLPQADMVRNVILIEKKSLTSLKYPRKAGIPSKSPLGN